MALNIHDIPTLKLANIQASKIWINRPDLSFNTKNKYLLGIKFAGLKKKKTQNTLK